MLKRVYFQRHRVAFYMLSFLAMGLVFFSDNGWSIGMVASASVILAIEPTVVAAIVVVLLPRCRALCDTTIIVALMSSLVFLCARSVANIELGSVHFLVIFLLVALSLTLLVNSAFFQKIVGAKSVTACSSFFTDRSKEEVWRALRPKAGEEAYEWSGTLVTVTELKPDHIEEIAAIGFGQFCQSDLYYPEADYPNRIEVDARAHVGTFADGRFAVTKANAIKYKGTVTLTAGEDGTTRVDHDLTYYDLSPLVFLGFLFEDFGADMATSMMARLNGVRDWSMVGAIMAKGRKEALALRGDA